MINVYIIQPVIPHYRVSLFEALVDTSGFRVEIHASSMVPGSPPSEEGLPEWADISHRCVSLFGKRLFWQLDLDVPSRFGRGDVLVINGNPRFLSTARVVIAARRRGLGIIWWGHGMSPTSVRWRAKIRYQLMESADVVLLYTESEVDTLCAEITCDVPVIGLNNTLDLAAVRVATADWGPTRLRSFQENQRLAGKAVLLFCGRLRSRPSSDLAIALRALNELLTESHEYLLVVIGSGDEESSLKELAADLHIENHIRWLGPLYDEQALAPWFLSATCFVYPGSIGLSIIHAFGYGLPVITHGDRAAHNPEIDALRDGKNGLTFCKGDPRHLARQIRSICTDQSLRSKLAEEALRTVNNQFSFESMVSRFSRAIRLASERATEP